ncbi:MAG: hypothetical protein U1E20_09945 [Methylocystis sp.]|uniref:hypothetical protein n=1 Tax=Methylocystis sp. TaxID=1911079 RepID=UPI0039323A71
MSQLRAMRREFRAAFAVVAACALMLSLLLSGAARPAHAFAGSEGVACEHFASLAGPLIAASQDATAAMRHGAPFRSGHKCPECCLAAHANSAVLPERMASIARSAARPATIDHSAIGARPPESLTPSGANGARAPPAI